MDHWIPIFKAGTHTSKSGNTRTWEVDEVAQIAKNYTQSPEGRAAITIGHPVNDAAPAFGWIDELKAENGVLYAKPGQLHEGLREAIAAGHYKRVSSGLVRRADGTWGLDHLAVLGAARPAVAGLGELRFSASAEIVEFGVVTQVSLLHLPDPSDLPDLHDLSAALTGIPSSPRSFSLTPEHAMTEQEMQQRIQTLEAENARLLLSARTADFSAWIGSESVSTRVVPAQRERVLRIMAALDGCEQYEFSQDSQTVKATPLDEFRDFLQALPEQYTQGEIATHSSGASAVDSDIEYEEGLAIAKSL